MRVVALPGEEIEIKDGGVIIGGRPLDETYVAAANRSSERWGPKAIPDDEYERLVDSESLSRSEVVEGVEVHLSVETLDVRKDGDLRICIDASVSEPAGKRLRRRQVQPSYEFRKRKDGSVYY